ncbi:MAG: ABC transporter permease subunit [Bacillota bacterium]
MKIQLPQINWRALRNPMLVKELRSRTRTWHFPALLTGYLALLAGVGLVYYYLWVRNAGYGSFGPRVGLDIFMLLAIFQLILINFVTPALTSNVINGERERQTFDLLLSTPLPPAAIVLGKLFSSVSYILLLILASLPLYSIIFFFGGISLHQFFILVCFYLVNAIAVGAMGVFFSALVRKTQLSTVLTYGAVLFLNLGTVAIAILQRISNDWEGAVLLFHTPLMVAINPVYAMLSVLAGTSGAIQVPLVGQIRQPIPAGLSHLVTPAWQTTLLVYGVLTVACLTITILLVDPIDPVDRLLKRRRAKGEEQNVRTAV